MVREGLCVVVVVCGWGGGCVRAWVRGWVRACVRACVVVVVSQCLPKLVVEPRRTPTLGEHRSSLAPSGERCQTVGVGHQSCSQPRISHGLSRPERVREPAFHTPCGVSHVTRVKGGSNTNDGAGQIPAHPHPPIVFRGPVDSTSCITPSFRCDL